MHFPELSELGHSYTGEEGQEGRRRPALDGLAANLRLLETNLKAARQRTAPPVKEQIGSRPTTVKQKIQFFSNGAGGGRRDGAVDEVKDLEKKIEAERAKLRLQGAVLLPDGTIDWSRTAETVVYDVSAQAQGLTRLHFGGGLIYSDVARSQRFDTRDMVTHFGGKGWAIYVMSAEGNIHASSHSVGHRHHSSLLAGASVAGAGELRVLSGTLVEISNKSGHYGPSGAHLLQVLYLLQKRGVSLFGTKVNFKTLSDANRYPNVSAFMADMRAKGLETDHEWNKLMAYTVGLPFPTFEALMNAKGWRWGLVTDFIAGAPSAGGRGVVNIADGTQVPHRIVRKYLKNDVGLRLRTMTQSGVGR